MKLKLFRRKQRPEAEAILAVIGTNRIVATPKDYATLTEVGFKNVAAVFGAVDLIAGGASGIDWLVQKKTPQGWKEIEDHPLANLLNRPDPQTGRRQFFYNLLAYKKLAGNAYIFKNRVGSGPPKHLYLLRPDRVKIETGASQENFIKAYVYETGGTKQRFDPADILHIKEFDPTNDFYGLSRIEVAATSIDLTNWAMEWNLKLLQNDMRPPGAVIVEGSLNERQRKELKESLRQYQGSGNAGTPLIFEGGAKWQDFALSAKDIDWLNSEKLNLRRICSIFRLPAELLGDTESKTYSNSQEARRALYLETILPEMDLIRDEFNSWLAADFGPGLRIDYDRDKIEAIQEDRAKRYTYLTQADWLTINEKRQAAGYDEIPGGDVVLVSAGKVPVELLGYALTDQAGQKAARIILPGPLALKATAGQQNKKDQEPASQAPAPARMRIIRDPKWAAEEKRLELWSAFYNRIKAKEKNLNKLAQEFLKDQIKRALKDPVYKLNPKAEAAAWAAKTGEYYENLAARAKVAGERATKGNVYGQADEEKAKPPATLTDQQRAELERMIVFSGTKIAQTTMELIADLVLRAEEEGLIPEEITQRIWQDLGEFGVVRSRLIARTETCKVENWGLLEGYKEAEFTEYKGWLSAYAPLTREAHIQADQTYRENTIPLDQPFEVDGELLMFPGDPAGGPHNVCNCLCTTYPETIKIEQD